MNEQEQRAAFEEWATKQGWDMGTNPAGGYWFDPAYSAWLAWQEATRRALEQPSTLIHPTTQPHP